MKNTRSKGPRRLLIPACIAALLIVVAHSCEHPDVPYRAMPADATVASDHRDVRGRWRDFVVLPAVSNALAAARVDAAEFRDEPGWRILIPLTTGRNTVLACTPVYGADGEPVLWGASFAGWRRLVLRFLLATRWIPGLGRLEIAPEGSRYLPLGSKRHPSDWKVGFALHDNVLLAALSTDGDAVRVLERRVLDKAPLPPLFGADRPWEDAGAHLHRFWLRAPLDASGGEAGLRLWIDGISRHGCALGGRSARPEALEAHLAATDRLVGAAPSAAAPGADAAFLVALLPRRAAAAFLNGFLHPAGGALPEKIARDEDAVAYLTGAPYNGSFFGVRIPAATILCPGMVLAHADVAAAVRGLFGGGKYPQVLEGVDEKSRVLVPIRWQKGNALFKMYPQEYGVVELNRVSHGFNFCSARMSYDAQRAAGPAAPAPWREDLARRLAALPEGVRPVGFLWADLAPVADEIRQLLALSRIAVMAGALRLDADETRQINILGSFLGSFTTNGHLALLLRAEADGTLSFDAALGGGD